jgi:hypothetical protein
MVDCRHLRLLDRDEPNATQRERVKCLDWLSDSELHGRRENRKQPSLRPENNGPGDT